MRRERRGESRCSARPVCWRGVRWRRAVHWPCPRRALGETHRSVVSECRRGNRPASDCPRVELWGDPSFRGVGMPARSSPGVRLSPRRALGETHRSAVSVCRRGVRPASDCPRVELWGDPSFRGVGMPARSSPGVRLSVNCTLSFGEAYRSVSLGDGGEFA